MKVDQQVGEMPQEQSATVLTGRAMELIIDESSGIPSILHWGRPLGGAKVSVLRRLATRQEAPSHISIEARLSLVPEIGHGFTGQPGLEAHRGSLGWATQFKLSDKDADETSVTYTLTDENLGAILTLEINLDPASDVLTFTSKLVNTGSSNLDLLHLAPATLQLPAAAQETLSLTGRWAYEFGMERGALGNHQIVQENRKGRTSHDAFPALLVGSKNFSNETGDIWGIHLAWSGNTKVTAERLDDNRAYLQAAELFLPGEVSLKPGEVYETPKLFASFSSCGLNQFSQNFHDHIRSSVLTHAQKPRPVHLNTWEAVYFNHDIEGLTALADEAADIGVERYVLDDGWFRHRRDDRAGLGDWHVDETVYPEGLTPLIDHVKSKGLEFGLWVEPEMVNPDSDLFREHPDWVLSIPHLKQISARNQLVLDLTRPEVTSYLKERLSDLLTTYDISYLKWDMNRDIAHPGSAGTPALHKQILALYSLIDDLRQEFPKVEIESCASGGGRADLGILARTDRIWTSDCNDAHDRLRIQRGAQLFLPLAVLGSHIGAAKSHTTGRRHSLDFRAMVALFGHMGLEFDIRDLTEHEKQSVKHMLSLYKEKRALLHRGDFYRVDVSSPSLEVFGCVAKDRSEALFCAAQVETEPHALPPRICFTGLDPEKIYTLRIVAPTRHFARAPSVIDEANLLEDGTTTSGQVLCNFGLQLPMQWPDHALLFELVAAP